MTILLRSRAAVALLLASSLVASACGGEDDPFDMGFRRVSLDLVFKDATKASPAEAQRIIQVIELFDEDLRQVAAAEPEELPEDDVPVRRARTVAPPRPPEKECIPAEQGATPDTPVFGAVRVPPVVGSYARRNEGTIKVESDTPVVSPLTLPYPPRTKWDVTDVVRSRGTLATNPREDTLLQTEAAPPAPVVPEVVRFTLTKHVGARTTVIDTYQYYLDRAPADADTTASNDMDGDGVYLVRRETKSEAFGNSVFTPTPPVMMVPIGDETATTEQVNVGSGIDRETGAAMTVQSKILARETVDVCGELIDTYRVQFEEQFVDLSKQPPVIGGNVEGGSPNFWNISFSDRLLIAREEVHTVTRTSYDTGTGAIPVTVSYDYVSTLEDLEAEPIKSGSSTPTPAPRPDAEEGEDG